MQSFITLLATLVTSSPITQDPTQTTSQIQIVTVPSPSTSPSQEPELSDAEAAALAARTNPGKPYRKIPGGVVFIQDPINTTFTDTFVQIPSPSPSPSELPLPSDEEAARLAARQPGVKYRKIPGGIAYIYDE